MGICLPGRHVEAATYAGADEDRRGETMHRCWMRLPGMAGNSGVEFDLAEGFDSSDWSREKQYPHTHSAGTRKGAARKLPNGWGCYDMLGNVWEWCADEWSDTHEGADPTGAPRPVSQQDGGRSRVLRGGGWNDRARVVRSACRYGLVPDGRNGRIGFRCARGQASSGRRSGVVGAGREAEPRPEQTTPRPETRPFPLV